ncbi:MAG: penicillin-binding protein, partial [Sphingomonas sp.]
TPVNVHPSMVLGTSEVRVIDMTRAFASVANKGVAVTPYGITRVTANGQTIYTHEVDRSHVLVAPYVAAEMTDLLQTAVNTGTGRAAQIGRPVAGKTGTTTASKDGWFLGFSSGITTGVWMGRDDAKPIAGLHGGTAPAKAWAAFMKPATANRPIEQFDTKVTLPEWQLEPDEESYFGQPDNGQMAVDADGNPIEQGQPPVPTDAQIGDTIPRPDADQPETPAPPPQQMNQDWIDRVIGRERREPSPAGRQPLQRDVPRDGPRDQVQTQRFQSDQEERPNQ